MPTFVLWFFAALLLPVSISAYIPPQDSILIESFYFDNDVIFEENRFGNYTAEPLLDNEDSKLTVPQIISKYGYPVEVHNVTKADGYILQLHRIPYGRHCGPNQQKRVVFVQNGLLCDSSNWVVNRVDKALAFVLADACYDVWLGNARGNKYSRRHISFDPDKKKRQFWNFSWHEMGKYDLPANFDHILGVTETDGLYYIGHSMGTTMFFICMAENPEYNSKIKLMSALAPVAFTEHMVSPIRLIAPHAEVVEWLMKMIGQWEFLPSNLFLELISNTFCRENSPIQLICHNVLFLIGGFNPAQIDTTLLPIIVGHHIPAGASVRSLVHYAQGVKGATSAGKFRQFDYGWLKNLKVYKQLQPPEYDWSNMTAPIALYWGQNDWLGADLDTHRIADLLPNVQIKYRIPDDNFNHLDFLFAKDVRSLVYDKVIEVMEMF